MDSNPSGEGDRRFGWLRVVWAAFLVLVVLDAVPHVILEFTTSDPAACGGICGPLQTCDRGLFSRCLPICTSELMRPLGTSCSGGWDLVGVRTFDMGFNTCVGRPFPIDWWPFPLPGARCESTADAR